MAAASEKQRCTLARPAAASASFSGAPNRETCTSRSARASGDRRREKATRARRPLPARRHSRCRRSADRQAWLRAAPCRRARDPNSGRKRRKRRNNDAPRESGRESGRFRKYPVPQPARATHLPAVGWVTTGRARAANAPKACRTPMTGTRPDAQAAMEIGLLRCATMKTHGHSARMARNFHSAASFKPRASICDVSLSASGNSSGRVSDFSPESACCHGWHP